MLFHFDFQLFMYKGYHRKYKLWDMMMLNKDTDVLQLSTLAHHCSFLIFLRSLWTKKK